MLPCAAKFIGGYVLGEAMGRYVAGPAINKAIGGMFGNPMDVTTGRKLLQAESETDYVIPSTMSVAIKQFDSSSIEYAGTLGRSWVVPSASATYEPEHGRLDTVTLVHGDERRLAVAYGYDENGQLASVTDANGAVVRQFAYANGLMASHTNALGFTSSYVWSTIEGQQRVVATHTSEGEDWAFEYDVEGRQTRVRHADGRTAHWRFDAQFQIVEYTDFDGGFYRIKYNEAGMPVMLMLPGERTGTM